MQAEMQGFACLADSPWQEGFLRVPPPEPPQTAAICDFRHMQPKMDQLICRGRRCQRAVRGVHKTSSGCRADRLFAPFDPVANRARSTSSEGRHCSGSLTRALSLNSNRAPAGMNLRRPNCSTDLENACLWLFVSTLTLRTFRSARQALPGECVHSFKTSRCPFKMR